MSLFYTRRTIDGVRATRAMKRVLLVLLTDAANLDGYIITKATEIGPGAVFVCLDRLEGRGWATGEFRQGPFPPRRCYRLTPEGWTGAHALLRLEPAQVRRG